MQLREDADHVFLIVFGKVLEAFDDQADAGILIIEQGFFAVRGQGDVDLALVARVDAALDERALAVFQGANDARHLRRQDAEHALDVADDHGVVDVQQRQGEEFDFLEVGGAAAAAQRGQADLRDNLEQLQGEVFDTMSQGSGHDKTRGPGTRGRRSAGRRGPRAGVRRAGAFSMIKVDRGMSIAAGEQMR